MARSGRWECLLTVSVVSAGGLGCPVGVEPGPKFCLEPPLEVGERCEFDSECPIGSSCFLGACRARTGVGGPCTSLWDCAASLRCVAGTCTATGTLSLGDACSSSFLGDVCRSGVCFEGACAEPGDMNEPCDDETCRAGLVCSWWEAEGRRCRPLQPAGTPCDPTPCVVDAFCDASRTCQPRAGEGDSCADHRCGEGLFCRRTDETCRPFRALGETCRGAGSYCRPGLLCQTAHEPPRCTEVDDVVPEGGACVSDRGCAAGTFCDSGTCRTRLGEGELCTYLACRAPYRCVSRWVFD